MTTPICVIGVDPGLSGGIVAVDIYGQLVYACAADADHPDAGYGYVTDGCVDPRWIAGMVRDIRETHGIAKVVIEAHQFRPIEGRGAIAKGAGNHGRLTGAFGALGCAVHDVSAATWSTILGSKPKGGWADGEKKAAAVRYASKHLPSLRLTWGKRRKPHDGLADAACIALHWLDKQAKLLALSVPE